MKIYGKFIYVMQLGIIAQLKPLKGGKTLKKFKTALVAMLVVMMTLSSAVFGLTGVSAAPAKSITDLPTLQAEKPAFKVPEKFVNPEDPSKTVRVIVELEKAPTIERATEKGVLYKDLPKKEKSL